MRISQMFLIVALGVLAGCEFKGDLIGSGQPADGANGVWKIKATRLRVYPSTRFVRIEDQLLLEARIEFLDELGDSIKAAGTFVLEVFDAERPVDAVDAKRLFAWRVPMLTRESNAEFYDPVTRAYFLRLSTDKLPDKQKKVVFKVSFDRPGERVLSVSSVVKVQ